MGLVPSVDISKINSCRTYHLKRQSNFWWQEKSDFLSDGANSFSRREGIIPPDRSLHIIIISIQASRNTKPSYDQEFLRHDKRGILDEGRSLQNMTRVLGPY